MFLEVPLFQETSPALKNSWLRPRYLSNINNKETKEMYRELDLDPNFLVL